MSIDQLYQQINAKTRCDYPSLPLHELIVAQCQSTPSAVAVVCGSQKQTFGELDQKSDQLAAYLNSMGIGRGDLVGLCCDRNLMMPALLVGILKSGAGYVPLDPEYPQDRLAYMVDNSNLKHIIATESQISLVKPLGVAITIADRDWNAIQNSTCKPCATTIREPIDINSDVAYVIYTSGSTGKPKGVLVPHRSVVNMLSWVAKTLGFGAADRILATTTLSFDISVGEMFLPLITGGSVAVVERSIAKDQAELVRAIRDHNITVMQATPAMWRNILASDFTGGDHLTFVTGGEPLPRDLIAPMLARCGRLFNWYGPTETTVWSSGTQVISEADRILIGTPVANTSMYVVDSNNQLCPPETPGELLIGGDGVTLGYLGREQLTKEKFADFRGERVFRTGDLAQVTADGQIDHLGRMDGQIKVDGHRIELGEIDAVLACQPGVKQAATVLREDRPGDKRLVGYLLSSDQGPQPDITQVRNEIAKVLPHYMVPHVIVVVDQFHYTPSGKLDRKSFPPPSTQRPEIATEYVAPKSDSEIQVAKIWCDVLQLDSVGTIDNFFELGGSSLKAAQVVARIKTQLQLTVSTAEFFDNPTIAALLNLSQQKQTFREKVLQQPAAQSSGCGQFAIVGMAARMPGAANVEQFWDNLVNGRESIKFFSKQELDSSLDRREVDDENYVAARGVIDDADKFDARFFKTAPRNAEMTDPQQRVLLELAWAALEDAGIVPAKHDRNIGVWAGAYSTTYYFKNVLAHPNVVGMAGQFQAGIFNEKDYIATRIAHGLDLTGPAVNVNTACSTSLIALIEACKSLQAGHCNAALAGGVSITFPQNSGHLFQEGSIFSPDGHCRPFDANAAGTLFCDGAGIVVVRRLEDALEDKDRIYAVVKGFGVNNDGGQKASFSAPSIEGQAGAIAMAHRHANVDPETIGYIEAHGTATPVGDPIEVSALQTVFEAQTDAKQFCAIGSVKSNIGHTVAAAGIAGLIKTALALRTEQIPATLHYEKPNPQIDFSQSPFYVCDKLTPWPRSETPRRAGVSSFGVGGTNAHVLLEESPVANDDSQVDQNGQPNLHRTSELPVSILPISAKTTGSLKQNVANLAALLPNLAGQTSIEHVASALQLGRDEFGYRAAIVADSFEDAVKALAEKSPNRFFKRKSSPESRDIVFMFPGQGAQYVRMGQNLYEHSLVFRRSMDRCAEILQTLLERDLREVLFPDRGDESAAAEILKNTRFTQPALFALGYSLAQVWLDWGVKPNAMLGHSIGEFAAACVADVFSLEDGLKVIAQRGKAMQELPTGSMMSVRKAGAEVEPMLSGDLAIGSFNGPNLCVVSGPSEQVAQLQQQLESDEIACRHLHTSHAFHSPMMSEIVAPFANFVAQFQLNEPSIPILSTVSGEWMTPQQATDPQYWANHLRAPVRFSDAVTRMWTEEPSRILIELGPRKTLATLAKQHASDPKNQIAIPTLSDNANQNQEWQSQMAALAQVWLAGVSIDWPKISCDGQPKPKLNHISLPTYAFDRKRYFLEPSQTEPTSSPQSTGSMPVTTVTSEPIFMSRIPNIVNVVKAVFEDTSGFDLSEFDGETSFFEMGLDSLVLTQTATALKKELQLEVTFRQLLEETPTVDSLANWLDQKLPADKYAAEEKESAVATSNVHVVDDASSNRDAVANTSPTNSDAPSLQASTVAATAAAPIAPTASVVADGSVQSIVQQQLQLMQAQLQLIGGQQPSSVPVAPAAAPASPPTVADADLPVEAVSKPSTPASSAEDTVPEKGKSFGAAARVKLNEGELEEDQQQALAKFVQSNNAMMPGSKNYAQQHRKYLADPRTVSGFRPNMKEMTHPIVVDRSKGVHLWDIDGNQYIDFTCGFGSNLLGHCHPAIVDAISEQVQTDFSIGPQSPLAGEVAKLFCELTGNERMAFSNTGSEAVLGCTRLARNATGRDLVVMFNGDYHGILDEVIVRGSKKQKSFPAATGIPKSHVQNTLILDYGTEQSLRTIEENIDDIAAVLVEPVQSRQPELQPREFLQRLRAMTEDRPAALIFDEVITGLRIGLGGAQEHFGVRADLASYGKIVGGGMPIGIVAGRAEYMGGLDGGFWQYGDDSRPEAGMTYFAGTFVRHPLTLAASKAIMTHLKNGGPSAYDKLNQLSDDLAEKMNRVFTELGAPLFHAHFGSLFKIQFQQELVYSEVFFAGLRRRGMHIWDHRPCLLTMAHTRDHIDQFVAATRDAVIEAQRHGFMPGDGYKKYDGQLASTPPQAGAKKGKDENGNPGWFVPDGLNPGQFIQVGCSSN